MTRRHAASAFDAMPDEELMVVAPNRYVHRKLGDPKAKYVIMALRDLRRIRRLAKKVGAAAEFRALGIEVVPYDMDTDEG